MGPPLGSQPLRIIPVVFGVIYSTLRGFIHKNPIPIIRQGGVQSRHMVQDAAGGGGRAPSLSASPPFGTVTPKFSSPARPTRITAPPQKEKDLFGGGE